MRAVCFTIKRQENDDCSRAGSIGEGDREKNICKHEACLRKLNHANAFCLIGHEDQSSLLTSWLRSCRTKSLYDVS